MLNKEVCKHCINYHSNPDWDKIDDLDWKDWGSITCPTNKHAKINETPPEECPYILEHMVTQNVK